jgi:hypothetical protein
MAADHRIGRSDLRSPSAACFVLFGHFATEIMVIFLGCPDIPIQVQQPLGEFIPGGAAMKDQVVAILHLGKNRQC